MVVGLKGTSYDPIGLQVGRSALCPGFPSDIMCSVHFAILLVSNLTLQIYSCNCVVSTKQDLFKIKEQVRVLRTLKKNSCKKGQEQEVQHMPS